MVARVRVTGWGPFRLRGERQRLERSLSVARALVGSDDPSESRSAGAGQSSDAPYVRRAFRGSGPRDKSEARRVEAAHELAKRLVIRQSPPVSAQRDARGGAIGEVKPSFPAHVVATRTEAKGPSNRDDRVKLLIDSNVYLVSSLVEEILSRVPARADVDALRGAASDALQKAAAQFDPNTGVRFSRYATLRIRGALIDELRATDWVSPGKRNVIDRINAAYERLGRDGGVPRDEDVAAAIGLSVDGLHEAHLNAWALALEAADVHPQDSSRPVGSGMPEGSRIEILGAMARLSPQDRLILDRFYYGGESVDQIATRLERSVSYVEDARAAALARLRELVGGSRENPTTAHFPANVRSWARQFRVD